MFAHRLLIIFFGVVLAGFLLASYFVPQKIKVEKPSQETPIKIRAEAEEKEIALFFAGDIILTRGVEYMVNKYGQQDWKFPFEKIAPVLNKADILFGNLEGPISDRGVKVGSAYSFRMNPQVIEGLKFAGFDVLSLANNHTLDYGFEALEQTMELLREIGVEYVGAWE